jgi:branched-chain amino acid transport system substrate-binding protein
VRVRGWLKPALILAALCFAASSAHAAYSLVLTNGYGDCYRMNLLRDRENYQAYRGICSYRGFSLSGCSTTGEVVMLRIKATPSFGEHLSIMSTSMRWGTTQYVLNDAFRPLCSWVSAGYENWYPFDMSCSVAMYIHSGGYSLDAGPRFDLPNTILPAEFGLLSRQDRDALLQRPRLGAPKAYSLVMTNGYGDCYRMNLLRDRENYQAYRGVCSYRGFSLSGCSTTGEVVMLRIKATPSFGEYFSLVSTSMRWGTTQYFLNDVFRPLCSWVSAGYENWYPFDMSCSVAMYISSGGYGFNGLEEIRPEPLKAVRSSTPFGPVNGTNIIGVLLPLTGDLASVGQAYQIALNLALAAITNTPGMPAIRLQIEDTCTDASVAYDKLVALRSNGVHIVLGPETSEECRILKSYANENDVLLFSSSATAIQLALAGDNLMRLTLDDSHQAQYLADRVAADGITEVMLITRSDMYGEGLVTALVQDLQARGATVFATNYSPRATNFFPEVVSNLATQVGNRSAYKGAHRVGVVACLFDEGLTMLEEAKAYPALGAVRWYGSDGLALNTDLFNRADAANFASQTRLACSIFGRFTNALYRQVEAQIGAAMGTPVVPRYPMSSYDALWLVSLALQQTGGTQTMDQLLAAIRSAATNYSGCTGPIVFNSADDRSSGAYDFYGFVNENGSNQWVNLTNRAPCAPNNLAASDGIYTDKIRVEWNPASGAASYELWGAGVNDSSQATLLAALTDTVYDVTSAPANSHYFFWAKAANSSGASALSAGDEGWMETPGPLDIRINGRKGTIALASADTVSVTVQLTPGQYEGMPADCWLAVNTPGGWYYRNAAGEWTGVCAPAYQGPLPTAGPLEILNISGLAAGTYTFYFGVDAEDGVLDPATIYFVSVQLVVQ